MLLLCIYESINLNVCIIILMKLIRDTMIKKISITEQKSFISLGGTTLIIMRVLMRRKGIFF